VRPVRKLKATHQLLVAPFMDVAAWQLSLTSPQPSWCTNIKWVSHQWEVKAKDGTKVIGKTGDWVVASIDENSMVMLTNEEFKLLYKPLPF
jgi:hypothetical protein